MSETIRMFQLSSLSSNLWFLFGCLNIWIAHRLMTTAGNVFNSQEERELWYPFEVRMLTFVIFYALLSVVGLSVYIVFKSTIGMSMSSSNFTLYEAMKRANDALLTASRNANGQLVNDTMLNATRALNELFSTAGSALSQQLTQQFAPGLNLGFIALLFLSIAFHEHPATPMMGVFAAYLGGLFWMKNVSIWSFLLSHWLRIVVYAVGYIMIGAVWTVPKWWIFVRKSKNHEQLKHDYDMLIDKRGRSTVVTDEDRYNAALSIVSTNKYRFYTWMMWWPLNVIYTFARDPLTILYNWLYAKLTSTFAKILLAALSESGNNNDAVQSPSREASRSQRTQRPKPSAPPQYTDE